MLDDKEREQRWISFVQSIEPTISPQTVRLMGDWQRIGRGFHHLNSQSLSESGLSEAQYLVLIGLYIHEQVEDRSTLNPSEISKWRGTSRNAISSLIRGLEADGLIERRLNSDDKRKFDICLTAHGRSLVSQYAHKQFRTIGLCFNGLTPDEQKTFSELLKKIEQNIQTIKEP